MWVKECNFFGTFIRKLAMVHLTLNCLRIDVRCLRCEVCECLRCEVCECLRSDVFVCVSDVLCMEQEYVWYVIRY